MQLKGICIVSGAIIGEIAVGMDNDLQDAGFQHFHGEQRRCGNLV